MRSFLLAFCLLCSIKIFAQNSIQELMNGKDLSGFKVELLSTEDIAKYKSLLQSSGFNEAQAEQMAIQRGLPTSELIKLRNKLAEFTTTTNKSNKNNFTTTSDKRNVIIDEINANRGNEKLVNNEIFGADLFNNPNAAFDVNLRMPTPKNYIIGADDEICVDVFGYQEANYKLTVSPEGFINIPNVGFVSVNGLTIDVATQRIKSKMIKNGYSRLATGTETQLAVNISKIRTIKVTVIGQAVKPGTYSLSSLSTLFNAMYACGGPNEKGSLRKIELIRDNKIIAVFDAYDYLLKGFQTKNFRLNDQDVIRIPVATTQVKLKGEVMRSGIYELLPKESLTSLIEFAQGFTSKAFTATITIEQFTDKDKKIVDVKQENFASYYPTRGDEITVGKVLDRFRNRVIIEGSVFRPGQYELTNNLTLSQLIQKSEGLKEDAYTKRGLLYRTNADLSKQIIAFDVAAILNNKDNDILLIKDDSVAIASAKDFQQTYTITVEGEVKSAGVYEYYKGITLKDVLYQSGGFTDAASSQHIEVARRVLTDSANTIIIAQVLETNVENDLSFKGEEFLLQPWDVISIRTNPNYKQQIKVKIEGEVLYPGTYVLSTKEDKVSDILQRAGGLTPQADKNGANIIRINTSNLKNDATDRIKKIKDIRDSSSNLIDELQNETVTIGLHLDEILSNQKNNLENLQLQSGDIIKVPKQKNVVKINGEVMFPTEIVFKEGASIQYYIDKAGGFTDNAKRKRLYVLNANGNAQKTKKFLFFRRYPIVSNGSEILVPKLPDNIKKGLTTAEWLAVASGMASIAGIAVSIINVSKK